jgi:phospholipid transport system substrate-binding protein
MKKISLFCGCALILIGLGQVYAAQSDPIKMMQTITSNVQSEIKKNRAAIDRDPTFTYKIIDRIVLPHVDFIEMAKWIAGKAAWNSSSPKDQEAFIREFKILVVRTYSSSLNKYNDEKVEFFPLQKSASNTRIQVSSKITRAGKEDIKVDYRLIADNDDWKLYDIVIEGVSILKGFQAQFSEQIRNHGLSAVINKIKLHNEGKSE